jgi:pyruvate dehydrogenase E1 component beta subunit
MPASPSSIEESYAYAINHYRGPVVFLEHRLMYELSFEDKPTEMENPLFGSKLEKTGSDITVIATSVMVIEARRASEYLEKNGISVELIDLHSISHPDKQMILNSVQKTGKVLIADTSWAQYGVAAEINRYINEFDPSILTKPSRNLGMQPAPCPTAKALEDLFYPDVHDIVCEIISMVRGSISDFSDIPPKQSMTDFYKHFKGPF